MLHNGLAAQELRAYTSGKSLLQILHVKFYKLQTFVAEATINFACSLGH